VSQVDLFATILAHAGIVPLHSSARDLEHKAENGRHANGQRWLSAASLRTPLPGERPAKHVSHRTRDQVHRRFLRGENESTIDEVLRDELCDLVREPTKKHNILREPERLHAYRRDLGSYLGESTLYRNAKEADVLIENESVRGGLRALGYLH
jgi:hypothetical protein